MNVFHVIIVSVSKKQTKSGASDKNLQHVLCSVAIFPHHLHLPDCLGSFGCTVWPRHCSSAHPAAPASVEGWGPRSPSESGHHMSPLPLSSPSMSVPDRSPVLFTPAVSRVPGQSIGVPPQRFHIGFQLLDSPPAGFHRAASMHILDEVHHPGARYLFLCPLKSEMRKLGTAK